MILNKVIIYIGKTHNLWNRLQSHKQQGMTWDKVKFKAYPEEKLDEMERVWIQYFKPILNIHHKHEVKIKSKLTITSIRNRMKFRKMTRKSVIGFGKAFDRTVEDLIRIGKKRELCDIYFKCSHITFFDDILDEIGITEEWRIQKPGTNRERYVEFLTSINPNFTEEGQANASKYISIKARKTLKMISQGNRSKEYHRQFNQK